MSVYEGYKVYGPYTRKKDGRQIVILYNLESRERKTVSYPKYLVEKELGKYLGMDETVDHIDGNFLNNDIDNLRIVSRSDHSRSHTLENMYISKKCCICGKTFISKNRNRKTCGSKSCNGKCAHMLGHNLGNDISNTSDIRLLLSHRSDLDNIKSVINHVN